MSGMDKARSSMNLRIDLIDGTTATTNIAVTGIATDDEIIFCGHISTKAAIATLADITSEVSVTSAGNIQLSSTDTSSDQLMLMWIDTSK